MLLDFFRKLEKSKWLVWIGMASLLAVPAAVMAMGQVGRAFGILLVFFSLFAGVVLGGTLGRWINRTILKQSPGLGERLSSALSCFGALFLPPLVATWTNLTLATDIDLQPLGLHFLWACMGAGLFFYLKPETREK